MIKIFKKLKNQFPMDYIVDTIMHIYYICLNVIMRILILALILITIITVIGIIGLMLGLL